MWQGYCKRRPGSIAGAAGRAALDWSVRRGPPTAPLRFYKARSRLPSPC